MASDSRFTMDSRFIEDEDNLNASASGLEDELEQSDRDTAIRDAGQDEPELDLTEGMEVEGFAGPSQVVRPLTAEALRAFKAAQEKTGVIYISRIPPGMRPTKVRHLMSQHGKIERVYLQQEDAKRAYLRRKHTSTKKAHFTEGWVEFQDKKIARAVAGMLNAQPIGGKKGTRWRDDVWTMKYLPRFKWDMLTEQIAHEAAQRSAQLRVELAQSRSEQHEYLKNVELARVLDKRAERKKVSAEKASEDGSKSTAALAPASVEKRPRVEEEGAMHGVATRRKRPKTVTKLPVDSVAGRKQLDSVLGSMF